MLGNATAFIPAKKTYNDKQFVAIDQLHNTIENLNTTNTTSNNQPSANVQHDYDQMNAHICFKDKIIEEV